MATFSPNTIRRKAALNPALRKAFVFTAQAAIWLLIPVAIRPQTVAAPQPPKIEVASIRPVPEDRFPKVYYRSPPGSDQFVVRNENLKGLLAWAYTLIDIRQLLNAPGWFDTARWDILLKPEGTSAPDERTMKLLVQQLLRERFELTYHTQTQIFKGYRLIATKNNSRLTKTKGGSASSSAAWNSVDTRILVQNLPLSGLASALIPVLHDPVIDATGIEGNYDFSLKVATLDFTESTAPSLFSTLTELGLKLEKADIPLQIILIDHINRDPTEN